VVEVKRRKKEERKKSDILIMYILIYITDAELRISDKKASAFKAWKNSVKARLISLVLNTDPGHLTLISDEVHLISSLDPTEVGIRKVFSL
jgi:uncharacterized protein with von Willebrand factor type A (vWA) domain